MSEDNSSVPVAELAHRMNDALTHLLTNLQAAQEQVGSGQANPERLAKILEDASSGAAALQLLLLEFRPNSGGTMDEALNTPSEDTWDGERGIKRVLVVDDEPMILAAVSRALKNYAVETATGGTEAQQILADRPFDLVLCDLVMAKGSGRDLHRWLCAKRPELVGRLMFMTGGGFDDSSRAFLRTVNTPILHKPFDTKTLRWAVAQRLKA